MIDVGNSGIYSYAVNSDRFNDGSAIKFVIYIYAVFTPHVAVIGKLTFHHPFE